MVIPYDIHKILKKVASNEGIQNPSIYLHEKNKKGEIYFGEVYFIKIQDNETKEKREVVVKKSSDSLTVRLHYPVAGMYLNECQFYDTVWPTFIKFQESARSIAMLDEIPKCYASEAVNLKEMVVLENLRFSNFQTVKNNKFLDKQHFELVFDRYGKFHGISLAYKEKFPKTFREMSKGLYNYWTYLYQIKTFEASITTMLHECLQYLILEAGNKLVEKFQEYVNKGCEGFTQSCKYSGGHSVILHGDSCCNNLMFRYNGSNEPTDLKFIDFQIVRPGTPVFDLSYCLYSGGTRENFEELDHYLKIYHDALCSTVAKYECDATKLYPFEVLKKEWKAYCKFGFIMGLLLSKSKCIRQDEPMDIPGVIEDPSEKKAEPANVDTEGVKRRSLDLIKHMYKSGFL